MEFKLCNITKQYKKVKVVKDFSATLQEGIYGLLGSNGAGKTTLMNILTTVIDPSYGDILLNGDSIYKNKDKYLNILGYLPQDVGIYPHFSGREMMNYVACLKGVEKELIGIRVDEIGQAVNLSNELDKKCGKYSGGMKRRLGLACALLNNPHILILDEPTAGLDPIERIRFRNLIAELSRSRIVIISTHIVTDIENISDHIIMINRGSLLKFGSPNEILNELKGKVWEIKLSIDEIQQYESDQNIIQIKNEGNFAKIRYLSDVKPLPNCKEVIPELEDAFMFYMKK